MASVPTTIGTAKPRAETKKGHLPRTIAVVLLARTVAQTPNLDATWRLDGNGHLQLIATDLPWMRPALSRSALILTSAGKRVPSGRSMMTVAFRVAAPDRIASAIGQSAGSRAVPSGRYSRNDPQKRTCPAPSAGDCPHNRAASLL